MARTRHGVHLGVRLDSRIAMEAIILNRYECVPQTRRGEWLRRLLVQGFLSECSAVRGAQERPDPGRCKAFGDWLAQESKDGAQPKANAPRASSGPPALQVGKKPLAALQGVIGDRVPGRS